MKKVTKETIDKSKLVADFIILIEQTLALAIQSQQTTVDYVTHEDNKAENQYDTRGLEASYLARGQAERVADLRECMTYFKNTIFKNYTDSTPIGNVALIEIVNITQPDDIKMLLMMPKGGGLAIDHLGQSVQIVTASSPLGHSLLGKKTGDEIMYSSGQKTREYEIISVS
jgi:Transcription elongation factor, GreA/GreB, C-term